MDEIRNLSEAEIEAVAGGLQYNDNPQNYFMRPPPAVSPIVLTKESDGSSP
jgi:hypothetical protein